MKKFLAAAAVLIALSIALLFSWHLLVYQGKIHSGVTINNVDVGAMTPAQALKAIRRLPPPKNLTIKFDGFSETLDLNRYGAAADYKKTVKKAYSVGRGGNTIGDLADICGLWFEPRDFPVEFELKEVELRKRLREIGKIIDQPPVDAKLLVSGELVKIDEGQRGQKLNIGNSVALIKKGLSENKKSVALAVKIDNQSKTGRDIEGLKIEKMMAEFSTAFDPKQESRVENIKIASGKLDGELIAPGRVFSFYEVVGPVAVESGYKKATVIENGDLALGIGGGICQVATTLFNSYMIAGLPTVERQLHSNFIAAYPAGRDAGVATGIFDLKFKNDTDGHLLIKSITKDDQLIIRIYGPETGRVNSFGEPQIYDFVPYKIRLEPDSSLPPGVKVVAQRGVAGRTVKLKRSVTVGEQNLIDEEIVSKYTPRNEIIRVGPEAPQ